MGVSGKFLLTAVVAWSVAGPILFICSGDAYPTNEFFFQDEPHTLVRRGIVHKKSHASKINNNAIDTILDDTMNDQGSGDDSDEEIKSGLLVGSGDQPDGPEEIESGLVNSNGDELDGKIESGLVDGSGDKIDGEIESGLIDDNDDEPDGEIESGLVDGNGGEPDEEIKSESVDGSVDKSDGEIESGLIDGNDSKPDEEIKSQSVDGSIDKSDGEIESGLVDGNDGKPDEEIKSQSVDGSVDKSDGEIESGLVDGNGNKQDGETESELVDGNGDKPDEEIESGLVDGNAGEPGEEIESGLVDGDKPDGESESGFQPGTTEHSSAFIPTTRPPPLELVSIKVCGQRYYCPKGSRGPCPANEILVEENGGNPAEAPSYCSAYSNYPWDGCLSKVSQETESSSLSARCSLKSTEEPCTGYPPSYRYDPVTKTCRPAASSKGDWLVYECGADQVYIGLNRKMGSCQCMKEFHLIYTAENKCYQPFTRGPCDKNSWLVPSSRREANCRPSPCPENQIDGKHFYWKGHFHGPAGCYKPGTRGPCPERSTFIVTDYVLGHARCERDWNVSI